MSSTSSKLLGLATALAVFTLRRFSRGPGAAADAHAPHPETPPPPPPVAAPEPTPMPGLAAPPAPAQPMVASGTDHETIIGRWGIEARRLATLNRTLGQESGCATDCPVDLNALSLRRWATADYAYSFGLALGVGGGSSRPTATDSAKTWDTYFGIGPTVSPASCWPTGSTWRSAFTPQLDAVFFMPSSKGSQDASSSTCAGWSRVSCTSA